jgi:hypothetical protein
LEKLELESCSLDKQRFFNLLGANVCSGPRTIILEDCSDFNEMDLYLGSSLVPLLNNPMTKVLPLENMHFCSRSTDFPTLTAAFKSNEGLEDLKIDCGIDIQQLDEVKLLSKPLQGLPSYAIFISKSNTPSMCRQKN